MYRDINELKGENRPFIGLKTNYRDIIKQLYGQKRIKG